MIVPATMPKRPSAAYVNRRQDSQVKQEKDKKVKEMEAMALISALMLAITATGFYEVADVDEGQLKSAVFLFYCMAFTAGTVSSAFQMIVFHTTTSTRTCLRAQISFCAGLLHPACGDRGLLYLPYLHTRDDALFGLLFRDPRSSQSWSCLRGCRATST
jgi:hypothetical protein|eukprot:6806536-Prymnesium_polylepis.1